MKTLEERILVHLTKPFWQLTPVEKAYPLEDTIRIFLESMQLKNHLKFLDLTRENNFKGRKGEKTPDFYIQNHAAIEAKNVHSHYPLSRNNMDEGVVWRFARYPEDILRILIIGDPNYGNGVEEHLTANRIRILELGFFVTYENWVDAYAKIDEELPEMIFQHTL